MNDTIVALSSGAPPAAIGVIRISGPAAFAVTRAMAGSLPPPRVASLRGLRDPRGELIDRALLLTFPGPGSATGEDVAELHCHGGRAVARAVEMALCRWPEVRPARPGEFTRRALENGRIDLAQAEGLADLLAAETETQRRQALSAAEGALGRRARDWFGRLNALCAAAELRIDYDGEDDAVDLGPNLGGSAKTLAAEMAATARAPAVERLRDGVRVVIAGPPNSGKSSLINALVDRDVAIVSDISGTTRDRIEASAQREGVPFLLTDTAGLRASDDPIEAMGVERAERAIDSADIVVWLGDEAPHHEGAVRLHARADAPGRTVPPLGRLAVSAITREGVGELWAVLVERARALLPREDELALSARQRGLIRAAGELLDGVAGVSDPILVAESLRGAQRRLAALLGANATEAMLDDLFGRFCLGK